MARLRNFILIIIALTFGLLRAEEVEYVWNVDIEVNNRDPQASDTNPTTPFRTIQAAATNALGYARAGKSVRVVIHPGLYRESVTLRDKVDETNASIKFEASDPGNVVINGTDQINGWKIGDYDIFELPWTYQSKENPTVYVEGARLVEASSPDRVRQGQVCYVRGEEPKIYLLPPKGAAVKPGTVEVSRQDVGFRAEHVDGLYLESLAFERGFDAAIDIAGGDGAILNNIAVEYCHGDGVRLADLGQVRIRRLIVDRCGGNGVVLRNLAQLVISGVEAKLNNWSRSSGSLAGLQILDCGAVKVWSLKASENHGDGFVLAQSTGESQLAKLTVLNNRSGFVCRDNAQVASVSESQFAYNAKEGVVLQGGGLYLMANVFYGNGVDQLLLAEGETPSELQLSRNIIVALDDAKLINVAAPEHGIQAEKNLYDSLAKKPFEALGQALTFAQWQTVAGIDLDSFLGEAKLLDPENYTFTPTPQSPYFKMSRWPVRKLD
ncbi:right-handed parallel beta-helix repeat-containing protein [Cerasicoccus maritimus]|uniref:right-handed parallel beta-helix repeat-containing protein n=1 Tax=Cerasicoccus maritimus TaxID=490089 RepID=UPI002852BB4B|nr:right-handed parallel beta-helix repeat-containing protein [Cerasicoccus maritimus]